MKKMACQFMTILGIVLLFTRCNNQKDPVTNEKVASLNLKRGELIACGSTGGEQYGEVNFYATVPAALKKDFNVAVALLYSFEYDESEKMFAKIIDAAPDCAMAYWGVAMSNFHPLWAPPLPEEITKGLQSVEKARSIDKKTEREKDYIEAIARVFTDADKLSHRERVILFEKAMEDIFKKYPDDSEAPIFYALALNAAADPTDKTFSRQRKALSILIPLFEKYPTHPGLAHYIIHNSDSPALADTAYIAAKKYAAIAPASAHAQHMPSHIFTRLGSWDDVIQSNLVAKSSAVCYAEQSKIQGHWDEELHVMDYLMYGYLQKGEDELALRELEYMRSIKAVSPQNFKTAYSFAAMPSRYYLENRMWKEAAAIEPAPSFVPWEKFPWQRSIFYFTKLLGAVHLKDLSKANAALKDLHHAHDELSTQKDKGKETQQLKAQIKTGEAWIAFAEGKTDAALALMKQAADMEDAMEKHPVTPGEVLPARELYADMLMESGQPAEALSNYLLSLESHARRYRSLYGAGKAAQQMGDKIKTSTYYTSLLKMADSSSARPELKEIRAMKLK